MEQLSDFVPSRLLVEITVQENFVPFVFSSQFQTTPAWSVNANVMRSAGSPDQCTSNVPGVTGMVKKVLLALPLARELLMRPPRERLHVMGFVFGAEVVRMRWLITKVKSPFESAGTECAPVPVGRAGAMLVVVARGRLLGSGVVMAIGARAVGSGMGGAGRSEDGRDATGLVGMGPISFKAVAADE